MKFDNILLKIEYDGTGFSGWQRQSHKPTVQATVEDILRKFTGRKVVLYGASRTDAGVHAKGQIANFLFEVGILARTPRSGFHFLGTGDQTVAEHINRVSYIGYMLAIS